MNHNNIPLIYIVVIGVFVLGLAIGSTAMKDIVQAHAIKADCAYYDPETASFTWKIKP